MHCLRIALLFLFCLFCTTTALAEVQKLAVLEFRGVGVNSSVLLKLSNQSRAAAVNVLPSDQYLIMTRENMLQVLSDMGKDAECIEGACEIAIGRNIGADLIITGDILQMGSVYVLTLMLYRTDSGALLGSLDVENADLLALKKQTLEQSMQLLRSGLQPAASAAPSTVGTVSAGGFAEGVGMDVSAMLKQQQCRADAEPKGKQQRQDKLSAAVLAAQQQATEAWAKISDDLYACTELKLRKRGPCHQSIDQWLATASAMTAVVPSGTETVSTDCGPLQEAFAELTQAVEIAELAEAQALKQRLAIAPGAEKYRKFLSKADGYYFGLEGSTIDTKKAVKLYQKACQLDSPRGCLEWANLLHRGTGVKQDRARAEQLVTAELLKQAERSCSQGNLSMCSRLGSIHEDGVGVKQDLDRAIALNRKACAGGKLRGCDALGVMLSNGKGTTADPQQAFELFQKACDGGVLNACANLGASLEMGDGPIQDSDKATKLFEAACAKGLVNGCANLGLQYANGKGVAKNSKKAVKLYRKACDRGNMFACGNLGWMYSNGEGVSWSWKKAQALYRQACDGGDAWSCEQLGE